MKLNKNTIILRKRRTEFVNNFLKKLNLKDKRILDIGGEYGSSIKGLTKNNKCILIDANKNALKTAKKRGIETIFLDLNCKKLSFGNGYFDVIVITSVLEHLINPKNMIKEIKRIIKKDGLIIVSLPNDFDVIKRFKYLLSGKSQDINDALNPYTHLHLLSMNQWERFIGKHFYVKEIYNDSRISRPLAKVWSNMFSIEKIWNCKIK